MKKVVLPDPEKIGRIAPGFFGHRPGGAVSLQILRQNYPDREDV